MLDLLGELLLLFEELKFWKKKKKRRKIEEEQNLPKKTMIRPVSLVLLIGIGLFITIKILLNFFSHDITESKTIEKITEIRVILEKEKSDLGRYPDKLEDIIRNNPLRKSITIDLWGNSFYYNLKNNGLECELKSKGKDGILNTQDDINSTLQPMH